MGNIFETPEFALLGAALARSALAGQPNATSSAAYQQVLATEQFAQGLAQQKALEKAREKQKKEKKAGIGGALGRVAGTVLGGPIGGAVGELAGNRLAGGKQGLGETAINAAGNFAAAKFGGSNSLLSKAATDVLSTPSYGDSGGYTGVYGDAKTPLGGGVAGAGGNTPTIGAVEGSKYRTPLRRFANYAKRNLGDLFAPPERRLQLIYGDDGSMEIQF